MRVNIYAEEMTDRVEIISKEADGEHFTGVRFWLELPVTVGGAQIRGPFLHRPNDDDSSAITFWGKRGLRNVLRTALELLEKHEMNRHFGVVETAEKVGTLRVPPDEYGK